MSDLDLTQKTNFKDNQNAGSSQNLKDRVADAGAEIKQRAGDALRASTEVAQDKLQEVSQTAKNVASEAVDQFQDKAREQQRSGADFVQRFAGNIREAARAFESDAPFASRGINSAAEYVEDAAEKIRNGSLRDLVDNATEFARRQPAAFLGLTVLAGFAAVRFFRASGGGASSSHGSDTSRPLPSQRHDTWSAPSSGSGGQARTQAFPGPANWQQTSSSRRGDVS